MICFVLVVLSDLLYSFIPLMFLWVVSDVFNSLFLALIGFYSHISKVRCLPQGGQKVIEFRTGKQAWCWRAHVLSCVLLRITEADSCQSPS